MPDIYNAVTNLFYQLSNAFFWPIAIALLLFLALVLIDVGALAVQAWRRRREPATDLPALARALAAHLDAGSHNGAGSLSGVTLSPALRIFWNHLESRLAALGSTEDIDVWLEETLQTQEIHATGRLDRTRALVRIGPMLGLAGTIIPLGPALESMLGGDLNSMVRHLVIGFGAVVCGLVMSGVAYAITLVRERWMRVELKEMENLCELLLRAMERRTPRETRHEALFQA